MSSTLSRSFLLRPQPSPARLRLFCFPYAGGAAGIYRPWLDAAPGEIEVIPVQAPGRENRLMEPAFDRLEPLLDDLLAGILPLLDRPFAFFGYSMGATVAFELAGRLAARGISPRLVVVAARQAPHLPSRREPIHHLSPPRFIEELLKLEGTPAEVLAHPELLELITPLLRADFALIERVAPSRRPPVPSRLLAWGGSHDPLVLPEDLEAWRGYGAEPFATRIFPGGHFFLNTLRQEIFAALRAELL